MAKSAPRPSVHWFAPGVRRPIAYSQQATSHLIGLLAEDGLTFSQALTELRYDPDGRDVVSAYIERGYGDTPMAELGVRY